MKYQRRKTVLTVEKNWSAMAKRYRPGGMHSRGEQTAQSRTDNEGPPGPKGTGEWVKANEGPRARRRRAGWTAAAMYGGRAGREHPAARRAPRVPADLQAGPGPGSDRGQPAEARAVRAGPDDEAASCPAAVVVVGGEGPGPGRAGSGVARAGGEGLSPLNPRGPRLAPGRWRRSASSGKASSPRSAPSRPGPTPPHPTPDSHRHRSRRDHRTSRESVRPSPALGLPAQRRRRACAVASVPEGAQPPSDTCVQQVPARGPAPAWRSPLPLRLRPAPLRPRGPAHSGGSGPRPPRSHRRLGPRRRANRDFQEWVLLSRLALPSSRESGRLASLRSASRVGVGVGGAQCGALVKSPRSQERPERRV